jgi:hypothetical protein
VGSAASGTRGEGSDIDYVAGPSSLGHFEGRENDLPASILSMASSLVCQIRTKGSDPVRAGRTANGNSSRAAASEVSTMKEAMGLRRYWIRFDRESRIPVGFRMGCGITAHSKVEALTLLRDIYPREPDNFVVAEIVEDVILSDLDPKHVRPNIGDPSRLGVWFPDLSSSTQEDE